MSGASLLLLALACGVAVADDYDQHGAINDNHDANFKPLNSFHKILEGLTEANKEATKPHADEESRVTDKPQGMPGVSEVHNSRKKITVGDLLQAIIQKTKTGREKMTVDEKDEGRRTNEPEFLLGSSNDDKKFTNSKENIFGFTGNSEKANNSVMIINLGGVQGDELSFLNDLDHRKCLIYVVQPGGQPQLHPMNQLHFFLRSDVPKYVVLFGNGQAHLFGNSGLQYLNTLLANSVNIPNQPNAGVLPNNVPRTLIPLFNLLPNLGVHVINVLPNTWTDGMNPKQPNVHNHGVPIINIFPNIGKSSSLDIETTTPSSGIQGNLDIPEFLKPWINVLNNVTQRPVINPIIVTTTNAPDVGINWLDMLQKLPGMNSPDKETSKGSGDINSLLTILGIEQRNSYKPEKSVKPVSEDIIVTKNQNSLASKPTSPNTDNAGLSNNDLLLALTKLFIENNKNNIAKEQPEVAPKPVSPNIPDSTLINLLVNLISEKSSLVSKLDKNVAVDDGVNNKGLTETLLRLLDRKSDVMITSENEVKGKKMQSKLSEVLIELLEGHSNILLHGKGTSMAAADKIESKISETELYDILLRILRDHPSVIKGSKSVSGKSVMEDEEKLPNHILQLLGIQAGMTAEVMKPKYNIGSQNVIPNWPVSVSNEGFQPGGVGIDPQYLALLMKTFSAVNLPNNYGQSNIGGNVKFNLPQGFGGPPHVQANNGMWNYLLSHLGCVLDEGGGYGMNLTPTTNMATSNVGAPQGMMPLNNWLQLAQMSRNTVPNLYNAK